MTASLLHKSRLVVAEQRSLLLLNLQSFNGIGLAQSKLLAESMNDEFGQDCFGENLFVGAALVDVAMNFDLLAHVVNLRFSEDV